MPIVGGLSYIMSPHPCGAATIGVERFQGRSHCRAAVTPHLVPLIDSGEVDGMLYYVSAYIPGGSLRDRLKREGRLAVREALRIARGVRDALDFAHRARVVLRDVKPGESRSHHRLGRARVG